jgi:4-alpha-glucanotransferase
MRRSGILNHISSLPSNYGIGTFGKAAYDFIDFLKLSNQTFWQILPIGPTSYGDSPYQTFSAFAYNPYFIDLDFLVEEGLLERKDIVATYKSASYVDYQSLYEERFKVLRKAFKRFNLDDQAYDDFCQKNHHWLHDFSLFMAIKNQYEGASWLEWEIRIRKREDEVISTLEETLSDEISFIKFMQFKAFHQWYQLKNYANLNKVQLIGDMPIYVSFDSSDVWANPELFDLDEELKPCHIAGVPPDNFSVDGQLWGNPIYNWVMMEKNNYAWWVERVKDAMQLFDIIRIDHFIGFQNYFTIDYGQKTARNGVWNKGPGLKLFNVIKEKLGEVNIIAEDLGVITEDVRKLLKATQFPGMKLLQFAFDAREESDYLPHLYEENTVVYTGTHDNETTRSWFDNLPNEDLKYCLDYINHRGKANRVDSLIKATLQSRSKIAIIPIQDYLNLGQEARMNIPSTVGHNWRWRTLEKHYTEKLANKIAYFSKLYGRNQKL